jgi:hypothetical protein
VVTEVLGGNLCDLGVEGFPPGYSNPNARRYRIADAFAARIVADKIMPPVPAIKSFTSTQSLNTCVQPTAGDPTEAVENDVVHAFK